MLQAISNLLSILLKICLIFLALITGGIIDFIDIDELI